MTIRVRAHSGKNIIVDEPLKYVEILDKNGDVAMVFYKEKIFDEEAVTVLHPGMTSEMETYSAMYGVNWTKTIKGSWPEAEPVTIDFKKK